MQFTSLEDIGAKGRSALGKGPVCVVLCEDDVEITSTVQHHLDAGFGAVVLVHHGEVSALPSAEDPRVHSLVLGKREPGWAVAAINAVAQAVAPGTWMGFVFNAEYLFTPFSEHRSVGEALHFCTEERRNAVLTYVVDLYDPDLGRSANGVNLEEAHLDKTGYYALSRWRDGQEMERQMDFFGGLRWRFEEHVQWERRKIDRVSLFRAGPEIRMREDFTLTDEEMNTYACPWHNSLTATVCSFRAAKALATNPGSRALISTFWWHNSTRFDWKSQQLMEFGLMEPGQWF